MRGSNDVKRVWVRRRGRCTGASRLARRRRPTRSSGKAACEEPLWKSQLGLLASAEGTTERGETRLEYVATVACSSASSSANGASFSRLLGEGESAPEPGIEIG